MNYTHVKDGGSVVILSITFDLTRQKLSKPHYSDESSIYAPPPPPYFCTMRFWGHFLRENENLMYFVHDVVIESLVVIRYRVYLCT